MCWKAQGCASSRKVMLSQIAVQLPPDIMQVGVGYRDIRSLCRYKLGQRKSVTKNREMRPDRPS